MSFVNPLFILGALAAAVPLLLHLVKHARAHKTEFSTLMFLRRIDRKVVRYQRLRHQLLLLLRVLALLFWAFAFTRPFRHLAQIRIGVGEVPAIHVILLDNSMSMGYGDRWTRAREAASAIVRRALPGELIALLEFSDRTEIRVPPTLERGTVLEAIGRGVELTDRSTRYAQALRLAEQLSLDGLAPRRVLHLISDFQRSGWVADERDFRLPAGTAIEHVDVGADDFSNLTLTAVRIDPGEESSDTGLGVKFSAVNFGSRERKDVRIGLSVDGQEVAHERTDLQGGEVQHMILRGPNLASGPHAIELEVEDPELKRDNRYGVTMEARGKVQVLAIEGSSPANGDRSPSFFLSRALNVSGLSDYQLNVLPLGRFESPGALPGYLVIWNDAGAPSAATQQKLQDLVKEGGGLAVVLGDNTAAEAFNRSFGSWLPITMEASAPVREPTRSGSMRSYALLNDLRLEHSIFKPFRDPHSGNFSSAKFFRHARLTVAGGADVLARFDNGDAALVSIRYGKGRALVFASSADDRANDLPLKAVFAPFWQQIVRYLDDSSESRETLEVGASVSPRKLLAEATRRRGVKGIDPNQAVVVMDPDKKRVETAGGEETITLDRIGFYEIRSSAGNVRVPVNSVPRESDLTHGNAEEMTAAWVFSQGGIAAPQANDEQASPEAQDGRTRIWRYLLAASLAFLLGEGILSNR
jgi:hypothetical protein